MTQDIRFKLALDGASQVQAGLAGVGQAFAVSATDAQKMEAATAAAALAQAKLDAAVARSIAAQRAYADASKDTATSQATLTKLAIEQAQAQVNQVAAASKLREQSAAVKALETAHLGLATQTKLTTYQTAQMSAQLQDLFVQIQAGGNPMTALIQQGSQLSAVFGGFGNALKAVATLITPTTVALGALALAGGGLAAAYMAGAAESKAFADSIALTGNAAGYTEGRINSMSKAIGERTLGGVGMAREALQALISDGRLSGDALEATASAATALARATGDSAGKIASQFGGMLDHVADGARKLNDQYNFLSAAEYQQIKNLDDVGERNRALTETMRLLEARVGTTVQNLGTLEKAWISVKNAIGGYWDSIKEVNRTDTIEAQIKRVQDQIEVARKGIGGLHFNAPFAEQELAYLQEELRMRNRGVEAARARGEADRAGIQWIDEGNRYLTKQQQMELELAKARTLAAQAGIAPADLEKRLEAIRDKYKETAKAVKETGDAFADVREAAKAWAKVYETADRGIREAEASTLGLNKAQAELLAYLESPAYATNSEEMRQLAVQYLIAAHNAEENAAAQKRLADISAEASKAYAQSLDGLNRQADAARDQVERMRDEERAAAISVRTHVSLAEAVAMVTLERLREKQVEALGNEDAVRAIQREIDERTKLIDLIHGKDQREAAEAAAKDRLADEKRINDQIGQSLADALMQGGRSAREYIKGIFRSMVLRPIIQAVISPVTGSIATVLSGTASAANGYQASAGLFNTGTAAVNAYSSAAGFVGLFSSNAAYGAAAGAADLIAAFGPYALIALAIFAALGDHSKWSMGSVSETLFGSDGKFSSTQFALPYQFGYNTEHQRDDKATKAVNDSISTSLAAAFKQFGVSSAGLGLSISTDADREGKVAAIISLLRDGRVLGGTQTGSGSFGSALPTVAAEKIDSASLDAWFKTALPQVIIAALQQSDLTGRFKDYFDSVAAGANLTAEKANELLQTAGAVKTLSEAFVPLGGVFEQLGTLAVQTLADFAKVAGGFDALSSATQTYYQAFYTESERAKITTTSLSKSLASVGLVLPDVSAGAEKARIAYRALVDSQDLSTEAGQKAVTVLLQSAGAFGTLIEAATQAEQAAKEKAAAIAEKQSSLEVQLLRTQGNELAAVAKERELELAALRELDPALASLQQQIYDTADAAAKANLMASAPSSKITSLNMLESGAQAILGWLDLTAYKRQIDIYQPGALGSGVSVPQNWLDHLANNDPGWNREFVDQSAAYWKRALEMASDRSNKAVSEDYQALIARWNSSGAEDPKAKLAQDQLSATQSLISTLDSLEASLEDYTKSLLLGDLSTLSPEQQYAQARAAVDTALAQSRVGDLAAMQSAQAAIDAFLRTSKSFNASGGQYAADFEAMVAALEELKALQKQMLSVTAAAGAGTESAVRDGNAITQQSLAYQLIDRSRNVE